jgi:hypothetical protein
VFLTHSKPHSCETNINWERLSGSLILLETYSSALLVSWISVTVVFETSNIVLFTCRSAASVLIII